METAKWYKVVYKNCFHNGRVGQAVYEDEQVIALKLNDTEQIMLYKEQVEFVVEL